MTAKFTIRKLKAEDQRDLIDVYFSYFDELKSNKEFGLLLPNKKPSVKDENKWFSDKWRSIMRGDTIASVAVVDGKVVGLCDIYGSTGTPNAHVGHLGIAIRAGYRGIGIGKELMKHALENAGKRFEIVNLSVFNVNKNAIKLYSSLGFKKYGSLPNGIKRGKSYFNEDLMYLALR